VSSGGDYDDEMLRDHSSDDEAIEAFLRGQTADEELGLPALFAEDLRFLGSGPAPAPSPQLAALLASELPKPHTGPASQAAGPPKSRRRRVIITEFVIGLSVAGKAALGAGLAAASVTAVGATGSLPDPAQTTVAATVEAVTPFSFPGPKAQTRSDNFGATVSTDARDGGVDGSVISDAAKAQGEVNGPAAPGLNGLGKANQTPAAGNVRTDLPSGRPATPGSNSSAGLSTAATTPAAGKVPVSVPPVSPVPPVAAGASTSASGQAETSGGAPSRFGLDAGASSSTGARPAGRP